MVETIKIYVTIREQQTSSEVQFKKLILMIPGNPLTPIKKIVQSKISMLKREVEKQYTDLFPKEPTFICGKLEDEYGYSLSNTSFVYEFLKHGDRLYAVPENLNLEDAGTPKN